MTISLPEGATKYARTKTFDENTIPKPLLSNHSTKPNSWGLIVIERGELNYDRIDQPSQILDTATPGVIFPKELHKIAANGPVSFHIEFYHDPAANAADRDTEILAL